jgi:hypothetical protein
MKWYSVVCIVVLMPFLCNAQQEPVMSVIDFSRLPYEEMIQNGNLEKIQGTAIQGVGFYEDGYVIRQNEGVGNSTAAYCENEDGRKRCGLSWSFNLSQTQPEPIQFRGWSKAENVEGAPHSNYSLYVDLVFQDGSTSWGHSSAFRTGSHDWEEQTVFILPEKPVKTLSCYALFRNQKGKVWFDDFSVRVSHFAQDRIRFDTLSTQITTPMTLAKNGKQYTTKDGFSARINPVDGRVSSLSVENKPLPLIESMNGFLLRDVEKGSGYFAFLDGECEALQCKLDLTITASSHAIHIKGTLKDMTSKPRALSLVYAIPVAANGWQWGDHVRASRTIQDEVEYSNWVDIGTGSNGKLSRYPFASIHSKESGLGLGIDLGNPCQWRLGYSQGAGVYYVAMDVGVHPATKNFPSQVNFDLVLFSVDPRWGFRAAADKYYTIFPSYFSVRSKEQGIWMPFTDVSTVQGWQDFGFAYHEGTNNIPFDDEAGILSFRYSEPATWWMNMPVDLPRTYDNAMKVFQQHLASENKSLRDRAESLHTSGSYDEHGKYQLRFRNEPWSNGAVFSLNASPYLPGETTHASLLWNDQLAERLYGPDAKGELDGEYLDSLEAYVTADLNFCEEHFAVVTAPLTFTLDSRKPVIHKSLSQYEFTRYMSEKMHEMDKLLFANSVPYRFSALCPWLDVMGTETNWIKNKEFSPDSDAVMSYRRAMCAQKPFLFLMNTRFDDMSVEIVEKYFLYCLFYGMFPSMFSHNASEDPYWKNPALYNRDRPLFMRYQPMIKTIAQAGWEPVTWVESDSSSIWIERYGNQNDGLVYITVMNAGEERCSFSLTGTGGLASRATWTELISGETGDWQSGLASTMKAGDVRVYRIGNFK